MVGTASATLLTNGDFETGDLTGWITHGDVRIATGGPFASAQGMDGYYALLGLRTTDGKSTLRQDVDVSGLDSLAISFDWAFDYWDNSASAQDTFLSFVRQDGAPAYKITLLDLETNGTFWSPDGGLAYGHYEDVIDISSYTASEARVIFRLIEESDLNHFTGTASVAGIDNVSVAAPVPEPSTVLLLGLGLIGMAGYRRIRFSKKG